MIKYCSQWLNGASLSRLSSTCIYPNQPSMSFSQSVVPFARRRRWRVCGTERERERERENERSWPPTKRNRRRQRDCRTSWSRAAAFDTYNCSIKFIGIVVVVDVDVVWAKTNHISTQFSWTTHSSEPWPVKIGVYKGLSTRGSMIAVESRWLGTDHRQVAQCIVVKWIHTQRTRDTLAL